MGSSTRFHPSDILGVSIDEPIVCLVQSIAALGRAEISVVISYVDSAMLHQTVSIPGKPLSLVATVFMGWIHLMSGRTGSASDAVNNTLNNASYPCQESVIVRVWALELHIVIY